MNRPLPTNAMNSLEVVLFIGICAFSGLLTLALVFNSTTALLSALSLILYGFFYTPLKKMSSIAVFVGAIPGALPPLLGYVAATNVLDQVAVWLFLVQFFWQFPHFWAIGWFLYEDYEKAGFFMLPTGQRDTKTATQIILYTFWLIVASLLPCLGFTGQFFISQIAAVLVFLLGLWMLIYAIKLYQQRTPKAARVLMLVSVSYITLLQIIYITDKFLR
jgi:protoheme IX farnesyltransferase